MNGNGRTITILGTGSYLPEKVLTNADLEKMVNTSDEWIRTRTGISERRIAADDQAASDLAAEAARNALESAGIDGSELGMIIVATVTPDMPFPSTACVVQHLIGAKNAFCFDVEAACSGFLYGIEIARQFLSNGTVETALVIGSEKLSGITDWRDRETCVLFGDGAGAVVMRGEENDGKRKGVISTVIASDGSLTDLLSVPGGGSRNPVNAESMEARQNYIKMTGREVFKHAVRCMCKAGKDVLEKCDLTIEDVACIIPHQANMRIITAVADRLGTSMDRFCVNLDKVGNMSSASVPVALDEAVRSGRIKRGDIILFIVFGGGFTWGATVVEW